MARNMHIAEPLRSILNRATPAVPDCPMWRGIKIKTSYDYPPIPVRDCDWHAVTDNYDGADDCNDPIGYGATEQAAIDDLIQQLEDAS